MHTSSIPFSCNDVDIACVCTTESNAFSQCINATQSGMLYSWHFSSSNGVNVICRRVLVLNVDFK